MTRRHRSRTERARLFQLHGGKCHICGGAIDGTREKWDLDHQVPYALTQDDTDENLRPAHERCHRGAASKTSADIRVIAKAKRVAAKHIGAAPKSRNPVGGPLSKHYRRKFDGTVERKNPAPDLNDA